MRTTALIATAAVIAYTAWHIAPDSLAEGLWGLFCVLIAIVLTRQQAGQ